jgi:hypothetical protein
LEDKLGIATEELKMARCKLSLDLFGLNLKIIPEDPTLLSEKFELDDLAASLKAQLTDLEVDNKKKQEENFDLAKHL